MKIQLLLLMSRANVTWHHREMVDIDGLLQRLYLFKQIEYPEWKQISYEVYLLLVLCQAIKIIQIV